jgi:hypothetical protein
MKIFYQKYFKKLKNKFYYIIKLKFNIYKNLFIIKFSLFNIYITLFIIHHLSTLNQLNDKINFEKIAKIIVVHLLADKILSGWCHEHQVFGLLE